MEENQSAVDISLKIEKSDEISEVFIGYETTDGTEYILASAALPAMAELSGNLPSLEEE